MVTKSIISQNLPGREHMDSVIQGTGISLSLGGAEEYVHTKQWEELGTQTNLWDQEDIQVQSRQVWRDQEGIEGHSR